MSDANELLDTDWPRWLVAVAVRVDELVADPRALERFRRMLRDWKAEHDARVPRSPVGRRGQIRHSPIEILPVRSLTLPEKYAALAAIHDVVCDGAKRIDPWRIRHRHRNFARRKAGISYAVLCSRIKDLRDTDRDRIEGTLRDVEADLVAPSKEPTPAVDAPEKPLTDRLAEVAEPPRDAGEAVARLGDEWATQRQLADITGKTEGAIRSAIHRARKRDELLEDDVEPIPETRPGRPQYRLRVRGVWRFVSPSGERSRDSQST
jgi:hypothetical protein